MGSFYRRPEGKKGKRRKRIPELYAQPRQFQRADTGGCWETDRHGGDVAPASVWSAVGLGHRAHFASLRGPAAGTDPAAVEPPLESDPGQREPPAAAERLHGLATGRRDFPLVVPGKLELSFLCICLFIFKPQNAAVCFLSMLICYWLLIHAGLQEV